MDIILQQDFLQSFAMLHNLPAYKYLLIDFDNTLAFTNEANNLAYLRSIEDISQIKVSDEQYQLIVSSMPDRRITKTGFYEIILEILNTGLDVPKIAAYKNKIYPAFMSYIQKNQALIRVLEDIKSNPEIKIILVTNANPRRVIPILDFFNLEGLFDRIFYTNDSLDKYSLVISQLNLNPDDVVIIDDDEHQLNSAKLSGVSGIRLVQINPKEVKNAFTLSST
ncbi:HAD hydrolase-like protein [Ursidibacter maritimus]|uniref:phosphoglycolate phosphatase n=4 Tax=Ursidibacter maritimus TaxID=1331689 RepID=A0A949T6X0_9PAST|nr:HAD hydrolase-like protein [Ursidibacter maritimus]MBV6524320.1 HAD hydrolase-like protein [Ursidibacter maritimus]MBV6528303.1 HAD hydrolase-like protein [Ursidibacter maritimus]MBV6529657.1 HAD hydrolase-like protein [Ursidibacter maritimus]MBV6531676.1 HAD hydrolase-like protein [Ursidibacter maritimus]MBV6535478.1 HAD hydrolase-like protein [Ursidibacter maritimus]